MKNQKGHFIPLPNDFSVLVIGREKKFNMNPSGIYITYDYATAIMHYAGNKAGDSYTSFEIPSDPKFLKKFAREITKFAKRLEEERG
ncbi:hypothetical protein ACFIOZ_12270 [Vreelandella sp. F11]|uniref:hypothetical protein n=1 Tax=Vreelandella sp. F11 TaxID=3394751 RepID=UPI0036D85FE9